MFRYNLITASLTILSETNISHNVFLKCRHDMFLMVFLRMPQPTDGSVPENGGRTSIIKCAF